MDFISHLIHIKIIPFIKKWHLLYIVLGAIDILAITLAFQCSYYINYLSTGGFFFTEKQFLILFLGILPFWLLILYLLRVTEIPRTKRYRVLFFEYLQSALAIFLLLIIFYFIFKLYAISRLFLIELSFFGFLLLFIVRILEYKVFKNYRAKGYNYINTVVIADDSFLPFIERLLSNKEWGYKIVAIFTRSPMLIEKYEKSIILLPEEFLGVLNDLMEVNMIDEVLYIKDKITPSEVRETIRSCEELGITFRLSNKDPKINLTNAIKTNIAGENFLTFINIPHTIYGLAIKKIMDINISLLLIIILFPLFIIIGVLIKLTSPGPIIFRQARVGLRGRQFNMLKFRTMTKNADLEKLNLKSKNEADGPVFKIREDPRVTKIGGFLRKTGLDELPQLFNVLKGEMSLIGPRPPLQSETAQYKRWQLRRLSVKPGLSCFWQIKPDRNNIKFEKWMEMDLAYIDNWSIRLDIIILFKTIKTVFQRSGL
jgi:exopolysaccharide biosynthesis polyprenyl glycosylphosphotransferase